MNLFEWHRHEWAKWEQVVVQFVDERGEHLFKRTMQERRCRTCGRYQRRKIRR